MKLALIRRQFSATGGAELYLQRLLTALAEHGHELHLFTEAWDHAPSSVTVHPLRIEASRAQRPIRFADTVQQELARNRFDCVFSLERTRQQDVYRAGDGVHQVWLQRRRQFAPLWKRPFVGRSGFHRNLLRLETETFDPRNTRRIIVNSEMVRREILEHFSFPPERIHLVRNGVNLARFQGADRAEARRCFDVKNDEFLLLFVGSGWERKGLRYLLEAMGAMNRQTFCHGLVEGVSKFSSAVQEISSALTSVSSIHTAGSASNRPLYLDKLKLLVVGKGQKPVGSPRNVIFAGPMANTEIAYAAADLFVFLPIYEPSANVVFEALAAGLPVVTSAQNGACEVIEDNVNGSVVDDPSDIESVVRAIASWWPRRFRVPPVHASDLSLDRNLSETMEILEMAGKEKNQ